MLATCRNAALGVCALLLMAATASAERDHHGKTIKQCNEELRAGRAALAASGESPAKFIHDCWWQTKAGEPTPIAGRAAKPDDTAVKLKKANEAIAKARAEADAAKAEAARAKQEAAEARKAIEAAKAPTPTPDAKPAPEIVQSPSPKQSVHIVRARAPAPAEARRRLARRLGPQPTFTPRRIVEREPREDSVRRPAPLRIQDRARPAARPATIVRQAETESPPIVDWVPVHIATVPRPIKWPVFPEFVPPFRYAVNHPIVPGFTWTP